MNPKGKSNMAKTTKPNSEIMDLTGLAIMCDQVINGSRDIMVSSAAPAQGAAVADLTFGTNITAATANGSLTDSSATNPTEAQFNEPAKELGTKINDILAALRAAGVIAS